MCLVIEWSRSTTSPKWLIWLISGALIINNNGFVNISWVNVAFIVCIWYPNKFYGGQSSCNQIVFSRFCRFNKGFLSFLSFFPLVFANTVISWTDETFRHYCVYILHVNISKVIIQLVRLQNFSKNWHFLPPKSTPTYVNFSENFANVLNVWVNQMKEPKILQI